jgi:hypothetical protein
MPGKVQRLPGIAYDLVVISLNTKVSRTPFGIVTVSWNFFFLAGASLTPR